MKVMAICTVRRSQTRRLTAAVHGILSVHSGWLTGFSVNTSEASRLYKIPKGGRMKSQSLVWRNLRIQRYITMAGAMLVLFNMGTKMWWKNSATYQVT